MVWDPKKLDQLKQGVEQNTLLRNLEYQVRTLGMFRAWADGKVDNLDSTHPLTVSIYLPLNTLTVETAVLRLRLMKFRSYSRITKLYGAPGLYTDYTTGGSWEISGAYSIPDVMEAIGSHNHSASASSDGIHDHAGAVGVDGVHSHTISIGTNGQHAHGLVPHRHTWTLVDHQHEQEHGIYEDAVSASNVTVTINGNNVTLALGGPFNTDQDSLDLRSYLQKGWNTIEFGSSTIGRLDATYFVEIHVGNKGGR